jgi:hypothetical protein
MKTRKKVIGLTMALGLFFLIGCSSDDPNEITPESAVFHGVTLSSGYTEGPVDEKVEFTVSVEHPSEFFKVQSVAETQIDALNTQYEFIVERVAAPRLSTMEDIELTYRFDVAGSHTLQFFYKIMGQELQEFGEYTFAFNQ